MHNLRLCRGEGDEFSAICAEETVTQTVRPVQKAREQQKFPPLI